MLIAILIKSSSSCERRDFAKDKFMHFKQYITFRPFLILLLNNPCIQITYINWGNYEYFPLFLVQPYAMYSFMWDFNADAEFSPLDVRLLKCRVRIFDGLLT